MDLTLYRVIGGQRRVALGDLADGVEFYSAEKDEQTGVVTLIPVKVVTGASKAVEPVIEPSETEPATGDTPWDQ